MYGYTHSNFDQRHLHYICTPEHENAHCTSKSTDCTLKCEVDLYAFIIYYPFVFTDCDGGKKQPEQ